MTVDTASGLRSRTARLRRPTTPREVLEAVLEHVVRNPVEAPYARSDLFERRLLLMDDWAAYVAGSGSRAGP